MTVEPRIAQIAQAMSSFTIGRRGFIKGAAATGLGIGGAGLLAACGGSDGLNWSNWPAYIDIDDENGTYPTIAAFTESTGIEVNYSEEINDNDEFIAKVRNQFKAGKSTGRDIITITDGQASFIVKNGWVQKLDQSALPNVTANLRPEFKNINWDAVGDYHVPWQGGFTGIAWNSDLTSEVGSFTDLITRSDLKGKVALLSEMGDTAGFFLLAAGHDPANFTADDFGDAMQLMEKAFSDGQILRLTGNDYIQDMENGNLVACVAWSGDVISTIQGWDEHPEIQFSYPEEGYGFWFDSMMIPVNPDDEDGSRKAQAQQLMNYYYDPEVAVQVADYVGYMTPVAGAQEAMQDYDPEAAENEAIFPSSEKLAEAFFFMDLDEATYTDYKSQFTKAAGAQS